jgi:hypothetical protein
MPKFQERKKAFEKKFALDEELRFKVTVRRNKLLGLWAAQKMGVTDAEAEDYAKTVVKADFEKPGDDDVVGKLLADFTKSSIEITEDEIRRIMTTLMEEAKNQVEAETQEASD